MKDAKGTLVTMPVHSGKDVSMGIALKILRSAEISREEFIELERNA